MEETYDNNPFTQELNQREEAEEDTLSLSDLPIHGDAADSEDFPVGDQSPRSRFEQEHFEFSSEQLFGTNSLSFDPPQDTIVFCGKIIPYKEEESAVFENTENKKQQRRHRKWRIFRWKHFRLFTKSSIPTSEDSTNSVKNGYKGSKDGKCEFPERRVSIFATATKSRWYMIMLGFGSARFQTEMQIRDLRKRQSFTTTTGSKGSSGDSGDGEKSGGCGCGRGMRLIRFLGCGGDDHLANAIVKIS